MTDGKFEEKMMQRALGLVEGIAFGLGEGTRDVLLGAAEDIDSGVQYMETQLKMAEEEMKKNEEDRNADRALILDLLKDKDDLLTTNRQLRGMLEKMATEEAAAAEDDGEIATSATPPRNDKIKRDGCAFCNQRKPVALWGEHGKLVDVQFCPCCGRKL